MQIQRQLQLERAQPVPSYLSLIFGRKYRYRMFVGWYIQAMAQSTGVLVIANYMVRPSRFEDSRSTPCAY